MTEGPLTDPGPTRPSPEGDFDGYAVFGSQWALSPDGETVAVRLRPEQLAKANQYVVVLNWFEELKRLVPAR